MAFACALLAAGGTHAAESLKSRFQHPLRILVPFAPGGGQDTTARLLGSKMSELVGQEISKFMLDAYSAESRETHKFPLQYLPAFIIATGDASILALLADKCGCVALERSEMALLERGRIRKQIDDLEARDRELSHKGGRRA